MYNILYRFIFMPRHKRLNLQASMTRGYPRICINKHTWLTYLGDIIITVR